MKQVATLEEFAKVNHKEVTYIVKKFLRKSPHLDQDDAIQEVYLQMARRSIVERYDSSFGASFSTWVYGCIKNFLVSVVISPRKRDLFTYHALSLDGLFANSEGKGGSLLETLDTGVNDTSDIRVRLKKYREVLLEYSISCEPRRRFLNSYHLFEFYQRGYNDSEIAKSVGCTAAGVGASKRTLRKILNGIDSGSTQTRIKLVRAMQNKQLPVPREKPVRDEAFIQRRRAKSREKYRLRKLSKQPQEQL